MEENKDMLSKIKSWFKYWIVDKPEPKEEVEVSVEDTAESEGKAIYSGSVTAESGSVSATATPTRVRNKAGKFVADDPSTPDVNEAWVGGKAPAKKSKKKKSK
jgi:hypothetical protein